MVQSNRLFNVSGDSKEDLEQSINLLFKLNNVSVLDIKNVIKMNGKLHFVWNNTNSIPIKSIDELVNIIYNWLNSTECSKIYDKQYANSSLCDRIMKGWKLETNTINSTPLYTIFSISPYLYIY